MWACWQHRALWCLNGKAREELDFLQYTHATPTHACTWSVLTSLFSAYDIFSFSISFSRGWKPRKPTSALGTQCQQRTSGRLYRGDPRIGREHRGKEAIPSLHFITVNDMRRNYHILSRSFVSWLFCLTFWVFWANVSLCSLGWLWTPSVLCGFPLYDNHLLTSAFQGLEALACSSVPTSADCQFRVIYLLILTQSRSNPC